MQNQHRLTFENVNRKAQDIAFSDTRFVELEAIKRVMIQGAWYELIGRLRPVSITLLYQGEKGAQQRLSAWASQGYMLETRDADREVLRFGSFDDIQAVELWKVDSGQSNTI